VPPPVISTRLPASKPGAKGLSAEAAMLAPY
jgi:hypothetical protein